MFLGILHSMHFPKILVIQIKWISLISHCYTHWWMVARFENLWHSRKVDGMLGKGQETWVRYQLCSNAKIPSQSSVHSYKIKVFVFQLNLPL